MNYSISNWKALSCSLWTRAKILIIFSIYFLSFIAGLFNFYLTNVKISTNILVPFDNQFSVIAGVRTQKDKNNIVYGFLPYWTLDKIKYLHLDKLTDIAYFGLSINKDGTFSKTTDEGYIDPGYNNWKNSEDLDKLIKRAKEQGVRVSLTIISHTDEVSDYFLSCRICWQTFSNSLIKEMDSKGIQDVNLNFEYSDYTNSINADRYTMLVDFVNKELDKKYGNSFVVVSTFADSIIKSRVTNIQDLGKIADGLFIMAYDFHRPDSDNAGPVAPIGGAGTKTEYDIKTMLKDYLQRVVPNKLILGVPYYGYNWVVEPGDDYAKRIPGNDYIGYSQSQDYENIMETVLNAKPKILWDIVGQVPYFTYISSKTGSRRQVYYENDQSLKIKYTLAKEHNLAGIGIWALGYDGGYQELWNLIQSEFYP